MPFRHTKIIRSSCVGSSNSGRRIQLCSSITQILDADVGSALSFVINEFEGTRYLLIAVVRANILVDDAGYISNDKMRGTLRINKNGFVNLNEKISLLVGITTNSRLLVHVIRGFNGKKYVIVRKTSQIFTEAKDGHMKKKASPRQSRFEWHKKVMSKVSQKTKKVGKHVKKKSKTDENFCFSGNGLFHIPKKMIDSMLWKAGTRLAILSVTSVKSEAIKLIIILASAWKEYKGVSGENTRYHNWSVVQNNKITVHKEIREIVKKRNICKIAFVIKKGKKIALVVTEDKKKSTA